MPPTDRVEQILNSFNWFTIAGKPEYCGRPAQFPSDASEQRAAEVTA